MVRLFWVPIFLIFFSWLGVASAAERVLLTIPGEQVAGRMAGPKITALRETVKKKGRAQVIVGLRVPFAPERKLKSSDAQLQRAEIASATARLRARFDGAIRRDPQAFRSFDRIPFAVLDVTPEELARLETDGDVISISENQTLRPTLAKSSPFIRADKAWQSGYTGFGQTIAIIDTGVDKNHPFLAGKVVSEACYTASRVCPGGVTASTAAGSGMPCKEEGCEHGTHVAGIAAGLGTGFSGVAPHANIIAIQTFGPSKDGLVSTDMDILSGLIRVDELSGKFSIAAVNMSLGGGLYPAVCDSTKPYLAAAISMLSSAGIASVVASGNDGVPTAIASPACISGAVSVGSVSDDDWGQCWKGYPPLSPDQVTCYSNSVSFLSLLAPGSKINSSVPGNDYEVLQGTSMAAPQVAGAWAVLRQKAPGASVEQVLAALRDTGKTVTDYRNGVRTARINVKAALDAISQPSDTYALNYSKAGLGSGVVAFATDKSAGSCVAGCSKRFAPSTLVTLTATADAGTTFNGWSGACSGTGVCTVNMTAARSVSANFFTGPSRKLTYTRRGSGEGVLGISGMGSEQTCPGDCVSKHDDKTKATLTATASYGSRFDGWSDACGKTMSSVCQLKMDKARSISATFTKLPEFSISYSLAGKKTGTVTITNMATGAITVCDETCKPKFAEGTTVKLTASPDQGATFGKWSGGGCNGKMTSTCSFEIRANATMTASFN